MEGEKFNRKLTDLSQLGPIKEEFPENNQVDKKKSKERKEFKSPNIVEPKGKKIRPDIGELEELQERRERALAQQKRMSGVLPGELEKKWKLIQEKIEKGEDRPKTELTREEIEETQEAVKKLITDIFIAKTTEERTRTIENIGKYLKRGVDRVVVHENIATKDLSGASRKPDLDTLGALYLLNNGFNPEKEPNINYLPGAYTELVPKGRQSTIQDKEKRETILHIDTGGREVAVDETGDIKIFIDHHGPEKKEATSATALTYEILSKNGLLKENPAWLKNFVEFVNKVDNLSYLESKNKNGEAFFNEEYYKNAWPKTLYGIYKNLPFEKIIKLFENPKFDPALPLSESQIKEIELGEKIEVAKLIEKRQTEVKNAIFGVRRAIEAMEKKGIPDENGEMGKIVLHDFAEFQDKNNPKKKNIIKIPNELGFITSKALGYDTYIVWNPKNKNFFINSSTKDIESVANRITNRIPGTKLIRGVMIFPPNQEENIRMIEKIDGKIKKLSEKLKGGQITAEIHNQERRRLLNEKNVLENSASVNEQEFLKILRLVS